MPVVCKVKLFQKSSVLPKDKASGKRKPFDNVGTELWHPTSVLNYSRMLRKTVLLFT